MVGLTWGDTQVNLSAVQYIGILCNMLLCLTQKASVWLVIASTAIIFSVFWNQSAALDTDWLFRQGIKYQEATWTEFLEAMPKQVYIQYQTPFIPFLISRHPILWYQQLLMLPMVICNGILILNLFGNTGQYILAMPLYCVISSQPSADIWMFLFVLLSLRAYQLGMMALSSVLYGLSWLAKPLTIMILPGMILYLRWWILGSLAIWSAYIMVSIHYAFGQKQYAFLRHQALLQPFRKKHTKDRWQWRNFWWRYKTVMLPTLKAFWAWFFPVYTCRPLVMSIMIGIGILITYGNIKYFLLWSLFVFPIQKVNYA